MAVSQSKTDAMERSDPTGHELRGALKQVLLAETEEHPVARTASRRTTDQVCAAGYSGSAKPVYGFFCNNF